MTAAKYYSPYKDDPYGKVKGDKTSSYFTVNIGEAKVHLIDNGYILAGHINSMGGILPAFAKDEAIPSGLCAIPIYNAEYEIREKIGDKWEGVKYQPSRSEKALCDLIKEAGDSWTKDDVCIKGTISFIPDAILTGRTDGEVKAQVQQNTQVEFITPTGKLPAYKTPDNNAQRKGGSWSKGASLDEKAAFLRKELSGFLPDPDYNEDTNLGLLVHRTKQSMEEDEVFLTLYFDILKTIVGG